MFGDFPLTWNCLTIGFQAMLNFMGGIIALPDPVVSKATYDAAWTVNVGDTETELYFYFATTFDITFAEVEILPGIFAEAAIWSLTMYTHFILFQGTDEYLDPEPCRYSTGIFQTPPT
jgi:hypothetical protein